MILCPSIVRPNHSASADGEASADVEEEEGSKIEASEEEEIAAIEQAMSSGKGFDPEGSFAKMPLAEEPSIGEQAQVPQRLRCPGTPTASQLEINNLTHLPYRAWCPHCVATRKPKCGTLHFHNG